MHTWFFDIQPPPPKLKLPVVGVVQQEEAKDAHWPSCLARKQNKWSQAMRSIMISKRWEVIAFLSNLLFARVLTSQGTGGYQTARGNSSAAVPGCIPIDSNFQQRISCHILSVRYTWPQVSNPLRMAQRLLLLSSWRLKLRRNVCHNQGNEWK